MDGKEYKNSAIIDFNSKVVDDSFESLGQNLNFGKASSSEIHQKFNIDINDLANNFEEGSVNDTEFIFDPLNQSEPEDRDPEKELLQKMIDMDIYTNRGEFTLRAITIGILIGALVAAVNVNFGLRTGWTQGGSIFAVVVAVGIMKVINPDIPFTRAETIIAVAAASSAGTMSSAAGLVSSIPALKLLGYNYSAFKLLLWGMSVAFFGVFQAVPFRKHMIVVEKLRFPSGTAAAETAYALFAKGSETIKKAKVLLTVAFGSGVFALTAYFIPWLEQPPFPSFFGYWGFHPFINPLLMGGGILSGPRSCISLSLGAIVGWGILSPIVYYKKWSIEQSAMSFNGSRGWILWVGVASMTADAFVSLLFTLPLIFNGVISLIKRIQTSNQKNYNKDSIHLMIHSNNPSMDSLDSKDTIEHAVEIIKQNNSSYTIPWYYWVGGIFISTIYITIIGQFQFNLKFYFIWIAIPLSFLLTIVAIRCVGSTDINPIGGMGKVTQLIFALLAPNQIETNILSAGIIAAGASQAGDMMQDLKMAYLHNISPRSLFYTQLIGVCTGLLSCIPIYKLYDMAYHIGIDIPAPAAHAWKAVAEILAKGISALPTYSGWGVIGGLIVGGLLSFICQVLKLSSKTSHLVNYVPSGLAFGIGMVVPAKQSFTMLLGVAFVSIWKLISEKTHKNYFFAISSGLIAGEGLLGIVIAILRLLNVNPIVTPWNFGE